MNRNRAETFDLQNDAQSAILDFFVGSSKSYFPSVLATLINRDLKTMFERDAQGKKQYMEDVQLLLSIYRQKNSRKQLSDPVSHQTFE